MNISQFFEHWRIVENPFRGEEARHDTVFARVGFNGAAPATAAPASGGPVAVDAAPQNGGSAEARARIEPATHHSDFDKIIGELGRPSTAIVFGEKGSGKTAIRLQIAERIA